MSDTEMMASSDQEHRQNSGIKTYVTLPSAEATISKEELKEVRTPAALPNFFGNIRERKVVFCLDTSGSMYASLDAIKEHLIECLQVRSRDPLPTQFNVIEFSTEVTQWCDKLVVCTPQTVTVAAEWIKKLEAKTGTNTLDALMAAFSTDGCEAVVLVTDGIPDQNPTDLLEQVSLVSGSRPVHCYYIKNGVEADQCSVEFLEDLAMETYGSFHIITIAQHGAIERVTPVYRAEASAEQIIRTTHGNVYPTTQRNCRLSTTLDAPIEYVIEEPGRDIIIGTDDSFLPSYSYYPYQDARYVYSYQHYPYQGWSRYRPAKGWTKAANKIIETATAEKLPSHLSPGPGSLLIGTPVLARRHEDGYFYKGTVKSQIMEKKFLVEFGPCLHGKFKEISYQETYLYDIVSYSDALRHSILVGDKVLAPWEPDGERHGPGTVIEGQEKRHSDIGAGEDTDLVVTFDHGKSSRLPRDKAVWIPTPLHERITFELQLPAKVRKEITATEDYPLHSLPGYPQSGIAAPFPPEYNRYEEIIVEKGPNLIERGLYREPYFVPLYPVHYKQKAAPASVKVGEIERQIPGSAMTKDELNEKVVSQLLEHKMMLEEIRRDQQDLRSSIISDTSRRLLNKRETIDENTLSTKKSVTFDEDTKTEAETRDSGHGSVTDILSDLDISDYESGEEEIRTRDVAVGTEAPILYKKQRRSRSSGKRPPWQYWKNEPAPSLIESNNFGRYRSGPFRECLMSAPLEARASKQGSYGDEETLYTPSDEMIYSLSNRGQTYRSVPSITDLTPEVLKRINAEWGKQNYTARSAEWPGSMLQHVDNMATSYENGTSVKESLGYFPRPPPSKVERQGPGVDISFTLGNDENQKRAAVKRNSRRHRIIEREHTWEQRRKEQTKMGETMLDQHRARVVNQLQQDWQRQHDEYERISAARDARRATSAQIRSSMAEKRFQEQNKQDSRLEALRNRRAQFEAQQAEKELESRQVLANRQAYKEQATALHWADFNAQRLEKEAQQAAQDANKRASHMKRIEHFRKLEDQAQHNKIIQNQVLEQRNAMTKSQIIP